MSVIDQLKARGFVFKKQLGQNFITDLNLLRAVAADAGIGESDTVVEIGAGAGTLTAELAKKAGRVLAFEIDKSLEPFLRSTLPQNTELYTEDILKMSADRLVGLTGGPFKVVANLPYYITTPIIFYFLESGLDVKSLTVMVQKEVADRLTASPGSKDCGALTMTVKARADAVITRGVSRAMFMPPPNVDSAVVRLDILRPYDAVLSRLIRAVFAMRRKTVTNNLTAGFSLSRQQAENALSNSGISPMARAEQLSIDDLRRLKNALDL